MGAVGLPSQYTCIHTDTAAGNVCVFKYVLADYGHYHLFVPKHKAQSLCYFNVVVFFCFVFLFRKIVTVFKFAVTMLFYHICE